jgi:hypothetical protein
MPNRIERCLEIDHICDSRKFVSKHVYPVAWQVTDAALRASFGSGGLVRSEAEVTKGKTNARQLCNALFSSSPNQSRVFAWWT